MYTRRGDFGPIKYTEKKKTRQKPNSPFISRIVCIHGSFWDSRI